MALAWTGYFGNEARRRSIPDSLPTIGAQPAHV
jgi:hypothetical protein